MKKVIVLGGSGFLGQHVMRLLKQEGHAAVSVSRREGCDIAHLPSFTARLREERPEAVINCAAHVGSVQYALQRSGEMVRDNSQLIINIYDAVRVACPEARLITPLSNCSYPGDADLQTESQWLAGPVHESVLAYGVPRRLLWVFAEAYRRQYGIRSVNWLVANAYGPGDHLDPNKVHALNGILIRLLRAQRAGQRRFEIWGSGRPIREWVYIEDVARILVASLGIDEQTFPLNLAQNEGHSIAEITRLAAAILGYPVELTFNTEYPDGAPKKILDDRQFRARYPDFRFTPLREGIERTIAYYRSVL